MRSTRQAKTKAGDRIKEFSTENTRSRSQVVRKSSSSPNVTVIKRKLSFSSRNSSRSLGSVSQENLQDIKLSLVNTNSLPSSIRNSLDSIDSLLFDTSSQESNPPMDMNSLQVLKMIPAFKGHQKDIPRFIQALRYAIDIVQDVDMHPRIIRYAIISLMDDVTYDKLKGVNINTIEELEANMKRVLIKKTDSGRALSAIQELKQNNAETIQAFITRFKKRMNDYNDSVENNENDNIDIIKTYSNKLMMTSFLKAVKPGIRQLILSRDFDDLNAIFEWINSKEDMIDEDNIVLQLSDLMSSPIPEALVKFQDLLKNDATQQQNKNFAEGNKKQNFPQNQNISPPRNFNNRPNFRQPDQRNFLRNYNNQNFDSQAQRFNAQAPRFNAQAPNFVPWNRMNYQRPNYYQPRYEANFNPFAQPQNYQRPNFNGDQNRQFMNYNNNGFPKNYQNERLPVNYAAPNNHLNNNPNRHQENTDTGQIRQQANYANNYANNNQENPQRNDNQQQPKNQ